MMKRTQKTVEKMAEILTNNDKVQEVMTMLAEKAEEKGLSLEEWEQVKVGILTNCFFMVAMKDEQIRNDLGMHHIVYAADLIPCGNNEQRQAYANGTRYPGIKG